jgi:hypothetical protein
MLANWSSVIDVPGHSLFHQHNNRLTFVESESWSEYCVSEMTRVIRDDVKCLGSRYFRMME